MIDKNVKNRLSTMSGGGVLKYKDGMREFGLHQEHSGEKFLFHKKNFYLFAFLCKKRLFFF